VLEFDFLDPSPLAVTIFAAWTEAVLVNIVRPVTVVAAGSRFFLFDGSFVTGLAGKTAVLPSQGEFRVPVVVEPDLFPTIGTMAGGAVGTVASLVNIVVDVAGAAFRLFLLLGERVCVARVAFHLAVASQKLEARIPVVVEPVFFLPAVGGMALLTIGTETAFVGIVQAMAVITLLRRLLVALTNVALPACDLHVVALKGKAGSAFVIEVDFAPGAVDMTLGTFTAQPAFVGVVLSVAIHAAGRGLPVLLPRFVAVLAGNLRMRACPRKIGAAMIEGLPVQKNDIRPAPIMLRVASAAAGRRHILDSPVKPSFAEDIVSDVLVAFNAELLLPSPAERFVAFAASIFELGMALDDRSGHDQAFEVLGPGGTRCVYQHEHAEASDKESGKPAASLAE